MPSIGSLDELSKCEDSSPPRLMFLFLFFDIEGIGSALVTMGTRRGTLKINRYWEFHAPNADRQLYYCSDRE